MSIFEYDEEKYMNCIGNISRKASKFIIHFKRIIRRMVHIAKTDGNPPPVFYFVNLFLRRPLTMISNAEISQIQDKSH